MKKLLRKIIFWMLDLQSQEYKYCENGFDIKTNIIVDISKITYKRKSNDGTEITKMVNDIITKSLVKESRVGGLLYSSFNKK